MKPIGTSILNLGRFVALPLAGLVLAAPAAAQNDPLLEEITVVAQKREQNIMDVPVAITAVTGAQIEASGIKDMIDLQQNVPGLIVGGSQTTTTSNFSIRGIGSTSNNFGVESSVGLYVDGVYRSRQSSLINELVDVQAVEVLRGPQGTLFGKNTAAGAINVRTVAPEVGDRNAFVDFTVGDLDLTRLSAASNFTLTDEIAVRATYFQSERDGYVDNYTYDLAAPSIGIQENAFNNRDRWGLRVQATYDNGENFTARIIGDYSEIDENCCVGTSRIDALASKEGLRLGLPFDQVAGTDAVRLQLGDIVFTDFDYAAFGVPQFPNLITGVSWDDYITSVNYLPVSQNQDRGTSVELNWDLESGATLTSVTAVRMFDTYDFIDPDFNDTDLAVRVNDAEQDSISQELRLAGTFGEGSNWLFGAYYFEQEITSLTETAAGPDLQPFYDLLTDAAGGTAPSEITAGVTQISQTLGLFGRDFPVGAPALPDEMFARNDVRQNHDGYAVFGQVDWELSDALTLTLGARYTDETKDIDADYTQTNPGTVAPNSAAIEGAFQAFGAWVAAGTPADPEVLDQLEADLAPLLAVAEPNAGWAAYEIQELSPRPDVNRTLQDDQVTGTAKLTWFANDATMLYLSYATGFKAGGTNADRIRFDPSGPDFQLFAPEKSASIEAGFKGDIGDHLRISAAIYQTDFEDFQSNTFEGSGFILRNAGDIEIRGAEVEFIWHPLDNTTISGYYAYNQGEYKSFERAVCWASAPFQLLEQDPGDTGQGFCDHSGTRIPYNPENRFQASLTQDFPMGKNNMFFRAEYAFASETETDGDGDPLTLQDDFGILNLRLGVDIADWNSTITLWGRNVTDERYYNGSFDPPLQNFGLMNSYPSEIATWGVTFRKNWD
ncbi:MAG: TonB-dependent receptor [Gammaproteobacteria bacterium]|nr:TonB-dependent receptor [Gammaproteobacteria bacterium]